MKKQDLIKVIREIVRQELKKELPNVLTQVFQNLMSGGKPQDIHGPNFQRALPASEPPVPIPQKPKTEMDEWKMQLRAMLDGGAVPPELTPLNEQVSRPQPPQPKQFTKNEKYNAVLNATRPFNATERGQPSWANAGGMSPAVAMAGAQFSAPSMPETGVGQMMAEDELTFMNNVPVMPGASGPVLTELPPTSGRASRLVEGQEGGAAPMESMGEMSALDVRNHPALPDSIKGILNRDYRSLVKAMDKKK